MNQGINLGDLAAQVVDLKGRQLKPAAVKAVVQNKAPPRDKNYTISPFRAIKDQRINKSAAMIVLLAVCSYTNRSGETWVGQQTIADLLQVSKQAIQKQMKRLIELGYIEVISKGSRNTSNRYRVVFDTTMTIEDVKAAIPAALQPDEPAPSPLSKEAAKERLKQAKESIIRQPQKLSNTEEIRQPNTVVQSSAIRQPESEIRQPPEVVTPTTSRGCPKEGFKVYKEGIRQLWKKNEFVVDGKLQREHDDACRAIEGWEIPTSLLGELLHHTKTTCDSRAIPYPTSALHFSRLGEDGLWDLIAGLPVRRATA